jgi:predicted small lipoprotein YifL
MRSPVKSIPASARTLAMAVACALAASLAGCGQKGPLYLPEEARDIVTRPAPPSSPSAPSSPETVDSPDTPSSPAPEVSKPEGQDEEDSDRKKDSGEPRR